MHEDQPILLIEDDATSAELLRLALKKAGLKRPLKVLSDGDQAVAYLSKNPPPALLLLDVNLPGKSGLEVLTWLRSRVSTRPLPVVMLTSSAASKDIDEALRLGIRAYCVKPADFGNLKKLARIIRRRVEGEDSDPEEPESLRPQRRPPSSLQSAP